MLIKNYKQFFLYSFGCSFISRSYKCYIINQMIISSISDSCNLVYEHYINQPMHKVERRLNFVIDRDPQLINSLDRNKNHPLINKSSHIPLNK